MHKSHCPVPLKEKKDVIPILRTSSPVTTLKIWTTLMRLLKKKAEKKLFTIQLSV